MKKTHPLALVLTAAAFLAGAGIGLLAFSLDSGSPLLFEAFGSIGLCLVLAAGVILFMVAAPLKDGSALLLRTTGK